MLICFLVCRPIYIGNLTVAERYMYAETGAELPPMSVLRTPGL